MIPVHTNFPRFSSISPCCAFGTGKLRSWNDDDAAAARRKLLLMQRNPPPFNAEPISEAKRTCEFPYFDDPVRGILQAYGPVGGENWHRASLGMAIDPGKVDIITAVALDYSLKDSGKLKASKRYTIRLRRNQ